MILDIVFTAALVIGFTWLLAHNLIIDNLEYKLKLHREMSLYQSKTILRLIEELKRSKE